MESREIQEKLMTIVENELPQEEPVDLAVDFVEQYGVDSVSLIRVLVDAEDEFSVRFDDRELALNRYHNFQDMVEVIEAKLQ